MTGIRAVLVANRAEVARRVIRTCRSLGLGAVAVFSDPDAGSPHVREADCAVRLPGSAAADTYLRADLLVAAALAAGADAVHPGYGFLSEDAGFAEAVLAAGLTWVGPPARAIRLMGSKVAAKELMAAAGVPCLPGVTVGGQSPAELAEAAAALGYPLLVKASSGGGGRGMRVVGSEAELSAAVASAEREAAASFGDGTVFLEPYLDRPRHLEVQVVADGQGGIVALGERDCSVQRRHQKVIEETPSPAVDGPLRDRLCAAAVAAARAVDYVGVGTVEFVLGSGGELAFLEMNTRLQVEHPVTEAVTGLDLVEVQLRVAGGEALPPEVLAAQGAGHAIEARLYAENPAEGYLPTSGLLTCFDIRPSPGIRVDSGVEPGSVVGTDYDGLLAKVIAHASTRDQAAARLAAALASATIHGLVTNRDLLVAVLRSEPFRSGTADTGLLERSPDLARPLLGDEGRRTHAVAAALADAAGRRRATDVHPDLPPGWRNLPAPLTAFQEVTYDDVHIGYRFGRAGLEVHLDGAPQHVHLFTAEPHLVDLQLGTVRRRYSVHRAGGARYVDSALGSSCHREQPRLPHAAATSAPGTLTAPMPGTVLRVDATAGSLVAPGDPLVTLEAMKMEHTVRAPVAGRIADIAVRPGQHVPSGAVLAVLIPSAG